MPGEGVINLVGFLRALQRDRIPGCSERGSFRPGPEGYDAGSRPRGWRSKIARRDAEGRRCLSRSLENLLTEQVNPASEGIDALPTERVLEIINAEDRQVARCGGARDPGNCARGGCHRGRIERGGRLFYIGAGTSGRLGVLDASECPPTFSAAPELVQGIMAGGEAALARATETTEDDPAIGARDLRERGFTGARCAGRDRRQRPHAVRAGRGGGGAAAGRGHGGHQLHARFGVGTRRAYCHHAADRARRSWPAPRA